MRNRRRNFVRPLAKRGAVSRGDRRQPSAAPLRSEDGGERPVRGCGGGRPRRAAAAWTNLAELLEIADAEDRTTYDLIERGRCHVLVPQLAADIHDLDAVGVIGEALFATRSGTGRVR